MAYPYSDIIYDTTSSHGYWSGQTIDSGTVFNTAGDSSWGYSRVSLIWGRTNVAGHRIDDVQIDFSLALLAGGGLISALGTTDMANAEGDLNTWWTAQKARTSSDYTLKSYVWRHLVGYGSKFTPIARTTAVNVVGTDANTRLPDQDSSTVTWRSASRRHWGRVYLVGLTTSWLSSTGLLATTPLTNTLNDTNTLASNLAGHAGSLLLGVGSSKYYGFLQMKQMEVDNVPDIQRRRRNNSGNLQLFKP